MVTCGLTACTPGSVPGPTLGIEYGRHLPFTFTFRGKSRIATNVRTRGAYFLLVLQLLRGVAFYF